MITQCYNWLYDYLFSGDLPAILAPVSEELCAILCIIIVGFALFMPIYIIYRLIRFISDLAR